MKKSVKPAPPVTDGRPAPLLGCDCDVCRFVRQERDLAENYQLYLADLLVYAQEDE